MQLPALNRLLCTTWLVAALSSLSALPTLASAQVAPEPTLPVGQSQGQVLVIGTQFQRLAQSGMGQVLLADPDGPQARKLQAAFARVKAAFEPEVQADLLTTSEGPPAQAGHDLVLVHQDASQLDDDALCFMLAHELAHIQLRHKAQLNAFLTQSWGAARQGEPQNKEQHSLAYQMEQQADALAAKVARKLGLDLVKATAPLAVWAPQASTTHPSGQARIDAILATALAN